MLGKVASEDDMVAGIVRVVGVDAHYLKDFLPVISILLLSHC